MWPFFRDVRGLVRFEWVGMLVVLTLMTAVYWLTLFLGE
jgi:hypothetical protein